MKWRRKNSTGYIINICFPSSVYRQEIRWARSRCLVAGSHFVHIGERLVAFRRVHTAGAEGTCLAREISHPFLHVDWLRKSTQEVSRSESDEASVAWGEWPNKTKMKISFLPWAPCDRWLTVLCLCRLFHTGDHEGQVDEYGTRRRRTEALLGTGSWLVWPEADRNLNWYGLQSDGDWRFFENSKVWRRLRHVSAAWTKIHRCTW